MTIASDVICSDCKAPLVDGDPLAEPRYACPECGSIKRTIGIGVSEDVPVRDGLGMKAKRPGTKRPYIEAKSGPSYSHKFDKHVHRDTLINRDNNFYSETVTDYETGEVIHHNAEPLSDHVDHGYAKFKKSGNK